MQSTVEQPYVVEKTADGEVRLRYASPKLSHLMIYTTTWTVLGFVIPVIPWIIGWYRFKNFVKKKNREIVIVPEKGIKARGIQLAFSDIKSTGLHSFTQGANTWAYVQANALGNEVQLSEGVAPALAEALLEEIRKASGMNWTD